MKLWWQYSDIEIYSIHNEGKSVVAERFIKTLKNKIYKYMTSISKNVYIDKLISLLILTSIFIQQYISKHNENDVCRYKIKHIY